MKCPNCGKDVPEGKAFCGYCGASMSAESPSDSEDRAPWRVEDTKLMEQDLAEGEITPIGMRSPKSHKWMAILSILFGVGTAIAIPIGGIESGSEVGFIVFYLCILAIAVAGLVAGILSRSIRPRGVAITGIVINTLVVAWSLFVYFMVFFIV